jgi:hypothetical protein
MQVIEEGAHQDGWRGIVVWDYFAACRGLGGIVAIGIIGVTIPRRGGPAVVGVVAPVSREVSVRRFRGGVGGGGDDLRRHGEGGRRIAVDLLLLPPPPPILRARAHRRDRRGVHVFAHGQSPLDEERIQDPLEVPRAPVVEGRRGDVREDAEEQVQDAHSPSGGRQGRRTSTLAAAASRRRRDAVLLLPPPPILPPTPVEHAVRIVFENDVCTLVLFLPRHRDFLVDVPVHERVQ